MTTYTINTSVNNSTITPGNTVDVIHGGVAATFKISGSTENISSGGADEATSITNGVLNVSNGGLASATTLKGDTQAYVSSGGSAAIVAVDSGATITILSGGIASGLSDNGSAIVGTGGIAYTATVNAAGSLLVSGGVASNTNLNGSETVESGGIEYSATVQSGASLAISAGGHVIGAQIAATATIYSGGFATRTLVQDGGVLVISSGGSAFATSDTTYVRVSNGGVTIGDRVNSGASEIIYTGGSALSTTVFAHGAEFVSSGGSVSSTTLDGGYQLVIGSATSTIIGSGGTAEISGVVVGAYVGAGGLLKIDSGGSSLFATVSNTEVVSQGGTAIGTYIDFGGNLNVSGSATGAQIYGSATIYSGGAASGDHVNSGATETVLAGGSTTGTVVSAGASEVVSSGATAVSAVLNSGTSASFQLVEGTAIATTINSGAVETVSGIASNTLVNSGGLLKLESGGTLIGTTLVAGGTIDLVDSNYVGGTANYNSTTHQLTISASGQTTLVFTLSGTYTDKYFHLSSDTNGGTSITEDSVPCYCAGTLIQTATGEIPVENLQVGDTLITASGQPRPIRWIGTRSYDGRFAARNRKVMPVLIKAGALADGIPARDLYVSPLHALFIEGKLIPAGSLLNRASILQLREADRIDYFHLELDTHDIILAEGAPAESYIDDDNRAMFQNASQNQANPQPAIYCADRVEDGPWLDAIRTSLASRARQIGYGAPSAITASLAEGPNHLLIPAGCNELRLISPTSTTTQDQRPLGQLLIKITLDGTTIDLNDPRLTTGFFPPELHAGAKVRWTSGDATIECDPADYDRPMLIETMIFGRRAAA